MRIALVLANPATATLPVGPLVSGGLSSPTPGAEADRLILASLKA
jgi:hypothetical protein